MLLLFDLKISPSFLPVRFSVYCFGFCSFLYWAYSLLINCVEEQQGALSVLFLCLYSLPCLFSYCTAAFNHCTFPSHFRWILITCYWFRDAFDLSLCKHCVCLDECMQAMLIWLSMKFILFFLAHISATDSINLRIDFSVRNDHWLYSVIELTSLCRI